MKKSLLMYLGNIDERRNLPVSTLFPVYGGKSLRFNLLLLVPIAHCCSHINLTANLQPRETHGLSAAKLASLNLNWNDEKRLCYYISYYNIIYYMCVLLYTDTYRQYINTQTHTHTLTAALTQGSHWGYLIAQQILWLSILET